MKKMTQKETKKANGGWGAYCSTCGWHRTYPWWMTKKSAQLAAMSHRSSYTGHKAYAT